MRISDWSSDVCSSDLIADMGKGEVDDLPGIARVSHDLLIAGHRRVEADLANRLANRAEAASEQDSAVSKDQYPRRSFGHGQGFGACHDNVLLLFLGMPAVCRLNGRGIRLLMIQGQSYRSEEHTSELQSLMRISYAVFCLK